MLPRDANLLLLALVAVSALACIASDYAGRRVFVYVFKPLTMVWVLALAGQTGAGVEPGYGGLVVTALLFSLAGDVLLMLPSDRFAQGLASFLVAHLVYVAAFWADGGGSGPLLGPLPFVVAGALAYAWLLPGLGRLRIPVAVYVAAIAAMAGLATMRCLALPSTGALLACAGATLFVVSDAALAANRFRTPFAAAQAVVLGTYFSGQCLIALSTGVGQVLLGGD